MNYLEKVKEAAMSAVGTIDTGVRKLAYRSEIHDRRKIIRKLKGEWGCFLFDHMDKKDREKTLQASYEVLTKQISEKQDEIHNWETKFLCLTHAPFAVKREKLKPSEPAGKSSMDEKLKCHKCDNFLTDESLECSTLRFHPHCFSCHQCSKDISTITNCFLVDGKPMCQECGDKSLQFKLDNLKEEDLLSFCNKTLEGFHKVEFTNFDPFCWRTNGFGFAALCANWRPDLIKWKSLTLKQTEKGENLEAIQAGLDALGKAGVSMLFIEADELRECDPKSLMTQVMLIQLFFQNDKSHPEGKTLWNENISLPTKFEERDVPTKFEERDVPTKLEERREVPTKLEERREVPTKFEERGDVPTGVDIEPIQSRDN